MKMKRMKNNMPNYGENRALNRFKVLEKEIKKQLKGVEV
jgi:hypothetical protein